MYKRITVLSWLLTVLFLGYNLYLWGGLAVTPLLGSALRDQAPRDNILAALYLSAGQQTVDLGHIAGGARRFAAARFEADYPAMIAKPGTAIAHVLAAQSWFGRVAFYGTPVMLVLSILLYRFRQKPVRSLGGG